MILGDNQTQIKLLFTSIAHCMWWVMILHVLISIPLLKLIKDHCFLIILMKATKRKVRWQGEQLVLSLLSRSSAGVLWLYFIRQNRRIGQCTFQGCKNLFLPLKSCWILEEITSLHMVLVKNICEHTPGQLQGCLLE